MKKKSGKCLISFLIVFVIVFGAAGAGYYLISPGRNYTAENVIEEINITLPKSETAKVTSTAKGDNQNKVATVGDDIYTFYLDNSGCFDAFARGNDKTMRLLRIIPNGEWEEFDSIPVWMHGNVLADGAGGKLYYTTYEEELVGGEYICSVKVYTYLVNGGAPIQTDVTVLADDAAIPFEANPRVGADIDEEGNVAVAFGNYTGTMFVHVLNAETGEWTKHSIEYYHDTYMNDCVLYPYVRIKGVNCVKVAANRDTSMTETGDNSGVLQRDYSRYFSYDGSEWSHFIFADLRGQSDGKKEVKSAPIDMTIDSDFNTHIFTKEKNDIHYYVVTPEGEKSSRDFISFKLQMTVLFVKTVTADGKLYYVVSGYGVKGVSLTGYIEVYNSDYTLLYRNNNLCKQPYVYVNKSTDKPYIDMMLISRDSKYKENSETHFIRLNINSL